MKPAYCCHHGRREYLAVCSELQ